MAYFDKYGVEFSDDRKSLICCPVDYSGEYIVPDGICRIENNAFNNCSGLTAITIPESVTNFGRDVFYGCTALTHVTWNAENCKDFTFFKSPLYYVREQIKSITFGEHVKHIPAHLCYELKLIFSVSIPNSVHSIGEYAFFGCEELTTISIPPTVTTIGNYAFRDCVHLRSNDSRLPTPKKSEESTTQKKFIISLICYIILAAGTLVGILTLIYTSALRSEEYYPILGTIILLAGIYLLYKYLKKKYDQKVAIATSITTGVLCLVLEGLLFRFSYYAAIVVEMVIWAVVIIILETIIAFKIFDAPSHN